MSRNKLWILGAIALIFVIAAGGWSLGIAPQLATASNENNDRAHVVSFNEKNQIIINKLRTDYRNIEELKNQLNVLQISVPNNANLSAFILELNLLADKEKITVKSIHFSDARPYSPSMQSSSVAGNQAPPPIITDAKITPANFVIIPFQISITGIYNKILKFVNDVQVGQRLTLISTLSSTGSLGTRPSGVTLPSVGASGTEVDVSIGGYIYVLLE